MPNADFFSRLGLLTVRNFLADQKCSSIRAEALRAQTRAGMVHKQGRRFLVDRKVRRVDEICLSNETTAELCDLLRKLRPSLEKHFGFALRNFEDPKLMVYREGDFYRPHRDAYEGEETPQFMTDRQVSISIFLNGEDDSYCGGGLTFYGLVKDERWENVGFTLKGEIGLLVAFPSRTYHSVEKILKGERYSIVTWYS